MNTARIRSRSYDVTLAYNPLSVQVHAIVEDVEKHPILADADDIALFAAGAEDAPLNLHECVGRWGIDEHGMLSLLELVGTVAVLEPVPTLSSWVGLSGFGRHGSAVLSAQAGFVDAPLPGSVTTKPEASSTFTLDDEKFVVCVPASHEAFLRSIPDLVVHTDHAAGWTRAGTC